MALAGGGPVAAYGNAIYWHAHEMVFGFAMAVIAGFVLTAVAMWTSRPALKGAPLGWLVMAWLAGRIAMLMAGSWSAGLVAALDLLFPVLLVFLFAREVVAGNNRRNYVLVAMLLIMALLNLLYHMSAGGVVNGLDRTALLLMIHVVLVLITIIAGRIVPSFTTNWLKMRNEQRLPVTTAPVEGLTIALTLLTGILLVASPVSTLTAGVALLTAMTHLYRLSRWRGLATLKEPILLVLHVAYLWLPVGYLLSAVSAFEWGYPSSVALHALTIGGIGSMILAMTTRVSLGHTGRPLHASRMTVIAYVLIMLAGIVRLLGPLAGDQYMLTVELSSGLWMITFLLFLWVCWPVLTKPRVD